MVLELATLLSMVGGWNECPGTLVAVALTTLWSFVLLHTTSSQLSVPLVETEPFLSSPF